MDTNINLVQERKALDFSREQLSILLYDGEAGLKRHRHLAKLLSSDPMTRSSHFYYEMTREEAMEFQYQKMSRLYAIAPEQIDYKNVFSYIAYIGTVSPSFEVIPAIASHRPASRHVRAGSPLPGG